MTRNVIKSVLYAFFGIDCYEIERGVNNEPIVKHEPGTHKHYLAWKHTKLWMENIPIIQRDQAQLSNKHIFTNKTKSHLLVQEQE